MFFKIGASFEEDPPLYKERHKIECLFGFFKHYRRLFARFDKSVVKFEGFLHLVLSHKMPIGSLLFAELDRPVGQSSHGRYKGQKGATVANLKDQLT